VIPLFLNEGPYRPEVGCISPYAQFCKALAKWIDDPVAQLEWLQRNDRVAIALVALGYAVAPLPSYRGEPSDHDGGVWIANVRGPGSRTLAGGRRVILEDGVLMPADMPEVEQRALAKYLVASEAA